jgi:hypothetical protein
MAEAQARLSSAFETGTASDASSASDKPEWMGEVHHPWPWPRTIDQRIAAGARLASW